MKMLTGALPISLFLILLASCSAQMVNTRGKSLSRYSPANEKNHPGGTIKYLNEGASSVIAARREDAYKQMYRFCGGKYNIVSEGQNQEGGGALAVPGTIQTGYYYPTQVWYIDFECLDFEKK